MDKISQATSGKWMPLEILMSNGYLVHLAPKNITNVVVDVLQSFI